MIRRAPLRVRAGRALRHIWNEWWPALVLMTAFVAMIPLVLQIPAPPL